MEKIFFSIVVPVYNRASHLPKALNSILAQNYNNFEVVIVDDGSTDNTKSIAGEFVTKDQRIKYFHKKNEERSIARNYGIAHAQGEYIGFLDSDDVLYPNHLTVANELLTATRFPEVGHLGFEFMNESGEIISRRDHFENDYREKLIHENFLHGNAIFIRRDVTQKINFIPEASAILSEDWYLWLRLAARYPFHFDNRVTSAVIHHDERSLLNINPDKLIASTNVVVEYLKKDEAFVKVYNRKVGYHFANHYTFLTLILSLTKSRRVDTILFLLKAISYDPTVIFRKRFLASVKHWF
jgi:glycosyltransferase involved in cell wall biosynthesis